MPLTMTDSTFWPPMAWTIISGLVSSTALTPLVIPVLYRLLMNAETSGSEGHPHPAG